MADSELQAQPEAQTDESEITEAMTVPRAQSARKVFIKVDMEGVSGVVSPDQVDPGRPEYDFARRMLMQDLKAVLDGVFAAGCAEAVVYDAHGEGRNIDLDQLDGRVLVISGRPHARNGFFCGLRDSFTALYLVGYHARAGASGALLPRTYESDIAALRVNSTEVGEVGLEAALAGEFGVPLVFVSGDSAAAEEGREILGSDIEAVEVKKAVSENAGVCLPTVRTTKLLREAARRALRRASSVPPVVFHSPATLEVDFNAPDSADALDGKEGIERRGEATVSTQGPTVLAAYQQFLRARGQNGVVHQARRHPDSISASTSS
jgi:D-amino peptidase